MGELISCARYSPERATRAYNGTLQPRTRQNPRQAKSNQQLQCRQADSRGRKNSQKTALYALIIANYISTCAGQGGIFRLQRGEPDASALSAALHAISFLKTVQGSHKK